MNLLGATAGWKALNDCQLTFLSVQYASTE